MASRRKDLQNLIERVLGGADIRYEVRGGGRHPKALIYVGGRTVSYTFASSPSDIRAEKNCEADLKRILREHGVGLDVEVVEPELLLPAVIEPAPAGDVQIVEFHGSRIETVMVGGEPHVALKPIVEGMGLAWQGQNDRVRRDPVLSEGISVTLMPSSGGAQRTTVLPLKMVNGFLFGINADRVKPELRQRVIAYQRECHDALAAYWFTGAAVKTDTGAASAADPAALDQMIRSALEAAKSEMRSDFDAVLELMSERHQPMSEADKRALGGIVKGIVRPIAEELAETRSALVRLIQGGSSAGAYNLSGRVTSSQIMTMAGVPEKGRARGAAQRVTSAMNRAFPANADRIPAALNPAQPWNWPVDDARAWLKSGGKSLVLADFHRAQVVRGRRDGGQGNLRLV